MKPCPFCGGAPSLQTNGLLKQWEVRMHCSDCGADGPHFRYSHQNERAQSIQFAESAWDCRLGGQG